MKRLFNWKYRYFLKKIRGIKKMILDLEFKRSKTRMIREDIRHEYDALRSKFSVIETSVKEDEAKKVGKMEVGELERMKDRMVLIGNDIERLKAQMIGLDIEVEGCKVTKEMPEGHQGINQQLDALRELIGMLKNYTKKL